MKLLIATPLYPPEPGGPATYARLLEEGLPTEGIETVTVRFGDVRRHPKLIRHICYFFAVWRAARDADAVLALDPVSVGVPALFAARLRRKRFLVKVVGDYAWEQGVQRFGITDSLDAFVKRAKVPFMVALLRAAQRHVASHAARVIVPSEYLKRIVQTWGIPAERIEVIYNAIELEAGGAVPEGAAALPRPLAVSVGRLVPWKGFEGVIDAVAGQSAPVSLAIAGDGPLREQLAAYAESKLGSRALLLGALPHADALAVMASADVIILNSTYEGLSHVLIEALMLGKAVIATDAGGNAELITDGSNGLLVPVGDAHALARALEEVLSDTGLRTSLERQAVNARERFSPAVMCQRTAELLHTV
jgi:glycosyltransferase involved in cell wall biosynthesis